MSPALRWLAGGIAVVVLVGVVALVFGPARGMRGDIAIQKNLLRQQLATTRAQLALQHRQLAVAQRQLDLAQQQLSVARRTYQRTVDLQKLSTALRRIAAQTLATARSTDLKASIQLQISRQLLALANALNAIARDTRRHAANIDRKTGPPPPG